MKRLNVLIVIGAMVVIVLYGFFSFVSTSNREVELRNSFKQKTSERTALFDNMFKTISQKSQIAVKNDSSFQKNVAIIMEGRKDAEGTVMKWIQESNPNANFSEVSKLYGDLSRAVEDKRDQFFETEKMLQDVKLQHDNLLGRFPSSIICSLLGRAELQYKPITSDRTEGVISTGKDNDIKVF